MIARLAHKHYAYSIFMSKNVIADYLIDCNVLKSQNLIEAFRVIERVDFVPEKFRHDADVNAPLSIGHGQTISQPLTVALMLEWLEPGSGQHVLDIGAGSGWQTAILAHVVSRSSGGSVIGLERVPELANFGQANLAKYGLVTGNIARIIAADGTTGWPPEAPYDRIVVAAAARSIPLALLKQLKIGGKLVIPVGGPDGQEIVVVDKIGRDAYKEQRHPGFAFVPFISADI